VQLASRTAPIMRLLASRGRSMSFGAMAHDSAERLIRICVRDAAGRRPVYGGTPKFQQDPHSGRGKELSIPPLSPKRLLTGAFLLR
jgi:hypothetical protein